MEIRNPVPFPEHMEVPGGGLREQGIGCADLGEYPFADAGACLFVSKLPQQRQRVRSGPIFHYTGFAVLRSSLIKALVRCVLEVPADGEGSVLPVDIRPLEAAHLASASSVVCGKGTTACNSRQEEVG